MRRISEWCFCCPYSELQGRFKEDDGRDASKDFKSSAGDLLKAYLGDYGEAEETTTKSHMVMGLFDGTISKPLKPITPTVVLLNEHEPTEEEKWKRWEEDYEMGLKDDYIMRCPHINKKKLFIDINRNFEIPEDDAETLRLLDKLSNCYTQKCKYNETDRQFAHTVDGIMKIALAKIDFALIERGKDFGRLIYDMYFPYYDRKEDLQDCGYSWELIEYYLNKYGITLISKDEYEAADKVEQNNDFKKSQEYIDALQDGMCDTKGVLKVAKAEYTRYATRKYSIKDSY